MGRKLRRFRKLVARWRRAEEGVTASEYAILLSLLVVGSMGVIGNIGSRIAGLYAIIMAAMPAGLA